MRPKTSPVKASAIDRAAALSSVFEKVFVHIENDWDNDCSARRHRSAAK
jgi:hypothetical protein